MEFVFVCMSVRGSIRWEEGGIHISRDDGGSLGESGV